MTMEESLGAVTSVGNTEQIGMMITDRKEGNILVNYTLNTFYLRLYGASYMVKEHLDIVEHRIKIRGC